MDVDRAGRQHAAISFLLEKGGNMYTRISFDCKTNLDALSLSRSLALFSSIQMGLRWRHRQAPVLYSLSSQLTECFVFMWSDGRCFGIFIANYTNLISEQNE